MGKIKTLNKQSLLAVPRKKKNKTKFKDNLNKRLTGFKRILTNNSLLTQASKTKKRCIKSERQNETLRQQLFAKRQRRQLTILGQRPSIELWIHAGGC